MLVAVADTTIVNGFLAAYSRRSGRNRNENNNIAKTTASRARCRWGGYRRLRRAAQTTTVLPMTGSKKRSIGMNGFPHSNVSAPTAITATATGRRPAPRGARQAIPSCARVLRAGSCDERHSSATPPRMVVRPTARIPSSQLF